MTTQPQTGQGGLEAHPPNPNGERARTPAEIEADIEATRERLAGTVDAIAEKVSPKNVARRGAESAKLQVVDDQGNPRAVRLAALAVGVAAVVGFLLWRRSR
jgi:hypothetical protein